MERIKKCISKIKNNRIAKMIIGLMIFISLFNINEYLNIVLTVLLVIGIFMEKNDEMLYTYIFLSFFDEVLIVDVLGGSISRIVMIVIILKLLYQIFKNKIMPKKVHIAILAFFGIATIIELVLAPLQIEPIVVFVNVFILVIFSMILQYEKKDLTKFIEELFLTIVFATLGSILYGILSWNFLKDYAKGEIVYRFSGTYEPNFMCMYIILGIISLMNIKDRYFNHKCIYYILMALFINMVILTISITGMIGMTIAIIVHLILNRKQWKKQLKDLIIILIITGIAFSGVQYVKHLSNEKQLKEEIAKIQQQEEENRNFENINKEPEIIEKSPEQNIEEEPIEEITPSIKEPVIENVTPQEKLEPNIVQPSEEEIEKEIVVEQVEEKSDFVKRIEYMLEFVQKGDWDRLTSGRLPIAVTFINASIDRPLFNVLFGNGISTKTTYVNYFGTQKYAHNSYIDCLYNFGLVGVLIILFFITRVLFKNRFLGEDISNNEYCNGVKTIRIVLLIFALSLSLYTKRMLLVFFLI